MRINFRETLLIICCAIFLSFIRYFFLDEYSLLKENRLNQTSSSKVSQNLYDFIDNTKNPQLINIDMAKSLYDNNLVTFIDARDLESYNEGHISSAINIDAYSLIDDGDQEESDKLSKFLDTLSSERIVIYCWNFNSIRVSSKMIFLFK